MRQYLDIINKILSSKYTIVKPTRTGIDTLSLAGIQFSHDMRNGFPLITTKKSIIKKYSSQIRIFHKRII